MAGQASFVIGLLIVLVVILMALFPQFIAPYDPIATDVTVSNQAPSAAHWFGTDFYGRDIFSRVIWVPASICSSACWAW